MKSSPLPSVHFDNSDLPRPQQFALWRDALDSTHDVALPDERKLADGFRAEATMWQCGDTLMVDSRTDAQLLQRAPGRIRADQIDYYAVRLHRIGDWIGEADDRAVQARAGEVMLLDLARPTKSRSSATDHFTLVLPREVIDGATPPADLHGHVIRGGLGLILADWLDSLARALPVVEAAQVPGLIDITRKLVLASVAPSRDGLENVRPALETGLTVQISRVIERDLGSAVLSPQSICRTLGVSRTSLYRACEPRGGVAAMIKQARLARINQILSDPTETRRIFEIAHAHGFVSEAHFSREFRRAFGRSPREARDAASLQPMASPRPATGPAAEIRAIWQRQWRG